MSKEVVENTLNKSKEHFDEKLQEESLCYMKQFDRQKMLEIHSKTPSSNYDDLLNAIIEESSRKSEAGTCLMVIIENLHRCIRNLIFSFQIKEEFKLSVFDSQIESISNLGIDRLFFASKENIIPFGDKLSLLQNVLNNINSKNLYNFEKKDFCFNSLLPIPNFKLSSQSQKNGIIKNLLKELNAHAFGEGEYFIEDLNSREQKALAYMRMIFSEKENTNNDSNNAVTYKKLRASPTSAFANPKNEFKFETFQALAEESNNLSDLSMEKSSGEIKTSLKNYEFLENQHDSLKALIKTAVKDSLKQYCSNPEILDKYPGALNYKFKDPLNNQSAFSHVDFELDHYPLTISTLNEQVKSKEMQNEAFQLEVHQKKVECKEKIEEFKKVHETNLLLRQEVQTLAHFLESLNHNEDDFIIKPKLNQKFIFNSFSVPREKENSLQENIFQRINFLVGQLVNKRSQSIENILSLAASLEEEVSKLHTRSRDFVSNPLAALKKVQQKIINIKKERASVEEENFKVSQRLREEKENLNNLKLSITHQRQQMCEVKKKLDDILKASFKVKEEKYSLLAKLNLEISQVTAQILNTDEQTRLSSNISAPSGFHKAPENAKRKREFKEDPSFVRKSKSSQVFSFESTKKDNMDITTQPLNELDKLKDHDLRCSEEEICSRSPSSNKDSDISADFSPNDSTSSLRVHARLNSLSLACESCTESIDIKKRSLNDDEISNDSIDKKYLERAFNNIYALYLSFFGFLTKNYTDLIKQHKADKYPQIKKLMKRYYQLIFSKNKIESIIIQEGNKKKYSIEKFSKILKADSECWRIFINDLSL